MVQLTTPYFLIDEGLLKQNLEILRQVHSTDDRNAALLNALRPFLREERRPRLDRALQLARMTRMIRVAIGVLGFLLDATAFVGLSLGSASTGTALLKCDILMVAVISAVIYKTRLTWRQWACMVVMLLGVFVTMGLDPAHLELVNWGNFFYLLSALFVSINAFVIKSAQHHKKNPVCDNVVAYYNNFVCMLCFIAASAAAGTLGEIVNCIRTPYYGGMLLLASVGQTLVYVVYYYDLRRFPVWFVKVFLLFMPVVASLICVFAFGETLTAAQLGGMAIILAGALGILLEQRKNEGKSLEPVEERG